MKSANHSRDVAARSRSIVDEALRLRLARREEMRSVAARVGSVPIQSSVMNSPTALERWHWAARD
jgi:hypothetical protein